MFVSEVLMEDKDNKGWVKGWAVVRTALASCWGFCDRGRRRNGSKKDGR